MKLRKDFITVPVLRYKGDRPDEKHADWLELLFDLIFVAAISQIALNLSNSYNLVTFLESLPLFFAIWWGWAGHTFYLDRFGTDDILSRIVTMVQMVAVASLAVNVKDALTTTGAGFAISYAMLRFILVAEYLWVGRKLPQAKPLTNRYSLGFGIAATIWLISAFVPDPYRFVLWGLALLIDFLTPFTAGEIHINFPPHPTHLPERFGLFSIIVIGEAILSLEVAVSNIGTDLITELMGLMGLIIAFALWWGYFEEAGGAEERVQDRGDQIAKYQLWLYSHFPFMLGVVGAAAGIKHVIKLPLGAELATSDTWIMCLSLAIALISISLIFISSFKWDDCRGRVLLSYRTPYYVIIALVIATGFLSTVVSGFVVLFILTILCVLNVIISLRETPEEVCQL